ncbi:MAG: hypothetical protein AAF480_07580 [Actinomycetota bacterium]
MRHSDIGIKRRGNIVRDHFFYISMLDIADDCPINRTADPDEDPAFYAHG